MSLPSVLTSAPGDTPRAADPRLRWRWLVVVRSIWLVLVAGLLFNFLASILAYYATLQTICATNAAQCASWQPTPENVVALHRLGLSVEVYAAYFISVDVAVSLAFWIVGAIIFWRKSDEWLGLFVSLVLFVFGSFGISDTLAGAWAPLHHTSTLVLALGQLPALLQWMAMGFFLVTFPTGRFAPRWTWKVASLWIVQFFAFDVPSAFLGIGFWPGLPVIILLTWGSTAAVFIYRYRRVFTPVQRQQTKWVVFGLATGFLVVVLSSILGGVIPSLRAPDSPYQLLNGLFTAFLFLPIPLAIGIAVLRYRLWDIDAIINRALVYGLLTALLGALYAGLIIGLGSLGGVIAGPSAQQPVVLVVSTLAIAALFLPLRRGIQNIIDRRFYRRKYDAEQTLAGFSATLRNEVDLEQVRGQVLAVVNETMQPVHVSLWLRQPERHVLPEAWRSTNVPAGTTGQRLSSPTSAEDHQSSAAGDHP